MSTSTSLTPADIQVLQRFPALLAHLSDLISGDLWEKFAELIQDEPEDVFDPMDPEFNLSYYQVTVEGVFYEYGFWMRNGVLLAGISLAIAPDAELQAVFDREMKRIVENETGWKQTEETMEDEEAGETATFQIFRKARPVDSFFSEPDADAAIVDYLEACMDEVAALQVKYPEIPWN